jgi:hypothetical protein
MIFRLLFLILAIRSAAQSEEVQWQPAKTWVFAVGVLKFDDPSLATWPDEGRSDAELIRVMMKRGVPPEQIVFLKNEQATRGNIVKKLGPFLQRAQSTDTLIFYYAGHGSRDYSDPARSCTFVTYDTKSNWPVESLFDSVEKNFHGRQVIYTADCCHSGALVVEAARRPTRSAALTSAHVSSTSTGNWTFTQCLVRMFEGSPLLDFNDDQRVTFEEAAKHVTNQMAFIEGQHADHGVSGGFPARLVISSTEGTRTSRQGEFIEAESEGKWWKAQILDEKEGEVFVTWPGWGRKYDEWLPVSRTRPFKPQTFSVGSKVQAEWQKQWFDATVVKVELGLHLVHYKGFPSSDDEWVKIERLRVKP